MKLTTFKEKGYQLVETTEVDFVITNVDLPNRDYNEMTEDDFYESDFSDYEYTGGNGTTYSITNRDNEILVDDLDLEQVIEYINKM